MAQQANRGRNDFARDEVVEHLAPKIPALRLDKDGWATHQPWVLAQDHLARGQSVILEWGHWARVERDEKRLGARALGVGVEMHYLDTPLEE